MGPQPSESSHISANADHPHDLDGRFLAVWEASTDAMALSDEHGTVFDANPAYFELCGYDADEVIGHSFAVIFPPEVREWAEAEYVRTFQQTETPPRVESSITRKDGTERWVEVGYTFLADTHGKRSAMLSVIRDITERRRADEMRLRLAAIVESSDDAIVSKDLTGIIQTWNHGAERIFGYTAEEVVGKPITIVIPPDRLDEEPEILRRICQGDRIDHFDTVRRRKDGALIDISLTVSPITDANGVVIGASKIARDVTERRELDRQKDAFIGIAAHELRTPVTGIKAYTQLLARRMRRSGDMSAEDTLAKLDRQVDRLTALIEDLLDVTRIESNALPYHPDAFDLDELLLEVVDEAQRTTTSHLITVEFDAHVDVVGDRSRVGQVVMNLLTNAIKYSPEADAIIVRTMLAEDHVIVAVQDFGIGIPPDEQTRVFDRFYRVTANGRDGYSGLGLGLYIAAEFVKRHGGKIWVESNDGQGSTVSFSLPLSGVGHSPADVPGAPIGLRSDS